MAIKFTLKTIRATLHGTPLFIGSSNPDFHIPVERVYASSNIFRDMGAAVTEKIYNNMGHTINAEELQYANAILTGVAIQSIKSVHMQTQLFPAAERGIKDIGWLKSQFHFSFSDYAHPIKSAFGTLITFNDDYVQPGKGFGIHPHQNMEIISVLLKGKMNHIDNLGYSTTIEEGGVQIMSAGSGLAPRRIQHW